MWELQLDRKADAARCCGRRLRGRRKSFEAGGRESLIFSMSLQSRLSVNEGGEQPAFHSHSLPREAFCSKYSRLVREGQPFWCWQIEIYGG